MVALCIGKATYNVTIPVLKYPEENSKMIVNEKIEGSGGSGTNVAYQLGKWNYETYYAGVVGYDDFGNAVKKDLESVNVHTNYLETNYEKKTTTSFIINNKETTSRTQIMIEPEIYHLKKTEFDCLPTVIYSDGFEYAATMAAVNKFPNSIIVLGAGLNYANAKEVLSLAKYAKFVIFSLELACEATKMTVDVSNPVHLQNLYKALHDLFPHSVNIITLKQNGVLYSVNEEIKYMPTIQVKEVDRSASGDVFDGTIVYGLGKGYDIEKSIRLANIAASLATTKIGLKESIPLLSDVVETYQSKIGPIDVNHSSSPDTSLKPEVK